MDVQLVIKELLGLFTSKQFLSEYWLKRPWLIQGRNDFLESSNLLSVTDTIEYAIKNLKHSICFYHNGSMQPVIDVPTKAIPDIGMAVIQLLEHMPIIVHQLHEFNNFYQSLLMQLGLFYGTNELQSGIFYSKKDAQGAKKHKDRSHIFVFQHAGECLWELEDPNDPTLKWNTVLQPGNILFIPQGILHKVIRMSDWHIHVTCGLRYKNPYEEIKVLHSNPNLEPAIPIKQRNMSPIELKRLLKRYSAKPLKMDN